MVTALFTKFACTSSSVQTFDFILDFIKGFQMFKFTGNFIQQKTPFRRNVASVAFT